MPGLDEYVRLLRGSAEEIQTLFRSSLMHGTSFFRDRETFTFVQRRILSRFFVEKSERAPLHLWVVGCSTGEEAYSLAMACVELADETGCHRPFFIHGTDVNAAAIEAARAGIYPASVAADLDSARLQRFFHERDGSYHVADNLRDVCRFDCHDVLSDVPQSGVALVACRNLIMYLDAAMQDRLLPRLDAATGDAGLLWLGRGESLPAGAERFELISVEHRLYGKRTAARRE